MRPVRERVAWIRPDPNRPARKLHSHPTRWRVTEPDGCVRYFHTQREALAWISANPNGTGEE